MKGDARPMFALATAAVVASHLVPGSSAFAPPRPLLSPAAPSFVVFARTDAAASGVAALRMSADESESAATSTAAAAGGDNGDGEEIARAPTLNGKAALPYRAMAAGLKGFKVAAVYATLDSRYKRG